MKKSLFGQYISMLRNEFKGYNGQRFLSDVIAGITVGAVALPLAIGFGAASVPNEYAAIGIPAGMITGVLAGIITGLLGGGSFQISGPTGTMSVILCTLILGEYGFAGMFAAGFLAGIIRILFGVLRLGKLIRFIPKPVVTGFTAGIALIIALGQIGNFFGVTLEGVTTVEKVTCFFANCLGDISVPATICSVLTVLLMIFYPKKIAKYIPGSLGALIVATAVTALCGIDMAIIGEIPSALVNTEHLRFGDLSVQMLIDVAGPAFSIAMLCMIETLLCGTCAATMKKEEFNPNTELVAQGVANLFIAFFGGVPSTAALARTSVAIRAGSNTRITGVFHSLFLVACMFILSGAIGLVPFAALAGVLVVTAYRMNDWKQIKCYFGGRMWGAIAQFLTTMLVTVLVDLTTAVACGIVLAFVLYFIQRIKLKNPAKLSVEQDKKDGKVTLKLHGMCYFANAETLTRKAAAMGEYDELTVDMQDVPYADYTACETVQALKESGNVTVIGASPAIQKTLNAIG